MKCVVCGKEPGPEQNYHYETQKDGFFKGWIMLCKCRYEKEDKQMEIKVVRKEVDRKKMIIDLIERKYICPETAELFADDVHDIYTKPAQGEIEYIEIKWNVEKRHRNFGIEMQIQERVRLTPEELRQINAAVEGGKE